MPTEKDKLLELPADALKELEQIAGEIDPETEYNRLFAGSCYQVMDGKFYRKYQKNDEDNSQYLGNFFILAHSETVRDNGIDRERVFELQAVCEGEKLSTEYIAANDFQSMNFITKTWGLSLRPAVAPNTMQYYRDSISAQAHQIDKRMVYSHTGWRKIGGSWAFLHAGGAIGAQGVSVELDGRLSRYRLREPIEGKPYHHTVFSLFHLAPKEIVYPLLGMVFLSPLNEFFRQAGIEPAFLLYLLGATGARKSTLAALFLSFFGDFDNKSLPASFKDTANSLEKQGFLLKDVLTVVDDFHPTGSRQDAAKMNTVAQAVSRAYGDRSGRGRMNADGTLRQSYIPRGNAIVTGEDIPSINQSGIARNLMVEIKRGDIDLDRLTRLQAHSGDLSGCMAQYLNWLIPQADDLPAVLKEQFLTLRADALKEENHGRIAETICHLQIGMLFFLEFMESCGHMTGEQSGVIAADCWEVLKEMAQQQNKRIDQDRPALLFLSALSEMLSTGQVTILNITDTSYRPQNLVGYSDDLYYYLFADTAYKAVVQFYSAQGNNFPVAKNTLLKHLATEQAILPDAETGRNVRQKKIDGKKLNLIWLRRSSLELEG